MAKKETETGKADKTADKAKAAAGKTGKGSQAAKGATAGSAKKASAAKKNRPEKLSAEQLAAADNAIKSKDATEELKRRAAAAKRRAQEKILEKSFVSDPPDDPLERLANTFDNSARRWEMVVYPSLFAFVLLAGYGFFLIYRLTHDISTLSHSVTRMAVIVSEAMPRMTKDLGTMTGSMDNMTGNISGMSSDIKGMTVEVRAMSGQMETLTPLSQNISNMTGTMNEMNRSVYGMQRDMGGMNRTISSGPFGMMNDFMPFSSHTNVAPPLPPPTYRQPWEVRPPVQRQLPAAQTATSKPSTQADKATGVKRQTPADTGTQPPAVTKTRPVPTQPVVKDHQPQRKARTVLHGSDLSPAYVLVRNKNI